jgi:uncharacterized protein (DUF1697 family)
MLRIFTRVATWVALLRAVNLGARNKVPMAALRTVLEEAGLQSVRTYIQSGNVVFAHAEPDAGVLEEAIAGAFGVETVVVLRSARQLRTLASSHPYGADTSRTFVTFLAEKPPRNAVARLDALAGGDEVARVGLDLVLRYPGGYQSATLTAGRIETLLGVAGTARNWRTVAKLAELAGQ